jgi:RNA polymerase sigma-70 factor (sigma-E family)
LTQIHVNGYERPGRVYDGDSPREGTTLVSPQSEVATVEPAEGPAVDAAASFEEYVATRGAALVRFAVLLTGDDHRAEDLVQDVLARAYLRWRMVGHTDLPDLYLRRMLVNASRSWWRRRSNQELPVERTLELPAAGDIGMESAERDAMWRLISRLPHRQRAVLVLRYYEDLDDATIAQILNCSAATVRTHAMRGLTTLRKYYKGS